MHEREEALAAFLGIEPEEVNELAEEHTFEAEGAEYLVLTDDEADEAASERIQQDLWAFNAEFIASHSSARLNNKAIEALRKMQGELCEDANDLVLALIEDVDHFVRDAISADGRGHFLSGYDGEENEEGDYFIYRVN